MIIEIEEVIKFKKMNGFTAQVLSSSLLSWQYYRVYRHLQKLSAKGYISIRKTNFSNSHRYWLSREGEAVIRAFHQHFWMIFHEVREKLEGFPEDFTRMNYTDNY